MASERTNQPIPIQEGYQPSRVEQRGYQPNQELGYKPNGQVVPRAQNLTPPKGATAIQPAPQASQPKGS